MFESYTEKARRVIFFARYEASQFGSPYIETEHLLLGLLREDKALTNRFLRSHASIESIRKQIEGRTPSPREGLDLRGPALEPGMQTGAGLSRRRKPSAWRTSTSERSISYWACCARTNRSRRRFCTSAACAFHSLREELKPRAERKGLPARVPRKPPC